MNFMTTLAAATLLTASAAAQGADDCSGATPISGFGLFAFNNASATASGIADCNGLPVRKDVWFAWTSPFTGLVEFETCGTTTAFDTRIVAYDGADCGALNVASCAASNCMGQSTTSFDAVSGQTYLLRPGSRAVGQGGPGQFRLSADPCPPTLDDMLENNDSCANAVSLGDGMYDNLWCSKTDTDWYSFCVAPGDTLTMDMFYTNANGNVDMLASDDCAFSGNLGIGGTMTDDESLTYTNAGATNQIVYLEVELWPSDPTFDCNTYSLLITGTSSACGGGFGTNYCMANTNSTGTIGAMSASGSPVAADNDVTLAASGLPTNSFSFFLTSRMTGFVMNPAGSAGNLCVGGSIGRYVGAGQIQQANSMGAIALPIDLTMVPQPNGFEAAMAGDTWNFQAWYRDVVSGTATSNFTDGLTIMFQ